jgi:cell division protein FtsI/penicillin-binding protein 2
LNLSAQTWQAAVNSAIRTAPESRILILDISSNRILAAHHLDQAAQTLSAPGSTLKPLLLYQLLAQRRWDPRQRISCIGNLILAGHRLACSHPSAPPFDARQALAWSCNTYFSKVAQSIPPGGLEPLLRPTGILSSTGLAPGEAAADFHPPQTAVETELSFLGVEGIRITPLELASAYRWLARELAAHPDSIATQTVLAGLTDSASFGMAGQAGLGGVPVAGKTGTAEDTDTPQTHGWFAGLAPAANPQVILVVYAPSGRGADAAHIAGILLAHSSLVPR